MAWCPLPGRRPRRRRYHWFLQHFSVAGLAHRALHAFVGGLLDRRPDAITERATPAVRRRWLRKHAEDTTELLKSTTS